MTARPWTFSFEYEVRLGVSLPLAWTTLLKEVAAHHYDYKCRQAGKEGVINGLHNTACDGEFPSNCPVSWRDLDLITKVMEQAHYLPDSAQLAASINQWLDVIKEKIEDRHNTIQALP